MSEIYDRFTFYDITNDIREADHHHALAHQAADRDEAVANALVSIAASQLAIAKMMLRSEEAR